MTGDWFGLRSKLDDHGISFNLTYVGDVFGVVSGGIKRGAFYNGLLDLGVDVDMEKLIGLPGTHLHVNGIYPHGEDGSTNYVGDLGAFSNISAYDSTRIYEAWIEQDFFNQRFSLRAGLITYDSEFGVLDLYGGLFIQSGFGFSNGPAINMPMPAYPSSALGARVKVELAKGLTFQAAVFDGNAGPATFGDPSPNAAASNEFNHFGTHLALRNDEGAVIAGEFAYELHGADDKGEASPTRTDEDSTVHAPEPPPASHKLAGSYKAGFIYHTDNFSSIRDVSLQGLGASTAPEIARGERGNYAIYASAEQEVWREPGTETDGLGFFGRFTWMPADRNLVEFALEGGASYRGLFPGRSEDALGLGFEVLQISPEVRRAFRDANRIDGLDAHVPSVEATVELVYRWQVCPWCSIQPHVQYVMQPGATDDQHNALIVGLRTNLAF